jgi:hypothetical protein
MNHAAPFIVVSRAVEDVREGVLKAGATAVFGKHVGSDALIDAIRVALKTHGKVRDAQTDAKDELESRPGTAATG